MIPSRTSGLRLQLFRGVGGVLVCLGFATPVLTTPATARAQDPILAATGSTSALARPAGKKAKARASKGQAGPQPRLSIPVTPLGYAPPASFYLGDGHVMTSLDFLDEDTLLFTFRVPGLIARERSAAEDTLGIERHIRAVTLALPSGDVAAEGLWVLHDYRRYLWRLNGRNFLVRDRNLVQKGDAALHLEPFLRFPGTVNALEFNAGKTLLIANTTEPPAPETNVASSGNLPMGSAVSPSTASTRVLAGGSASGDIQDTHPAMQNLVRILSMDSRKVMLFTRVDGTVHIPLDGEGYYEALRGKASDWLIQYDNLRGGEIPLGRVESTCEPALDALAMNLVLATACTSSGTRHLTALLRNASQSFRPSGEKDPARLWEATVSATSVWPHLATSENGLRMARSSLNLTRPMSSTNPIEASDIRGQTVDVYDLATGKVAITTPVTPILDGGGNFALSPSGNRFAVLNDGAIQVFDLPPAPPIPAPAKP